MVISVVKEQFDPTTGLLILKAAERVADCNFTFYFSFYKYQFNEADEAIALKI